jgi:hypothetical protein
MSELDIRALEEQLNEWFIEISWSSVPRPEVGGQQILSEPPPDLEAALLAVLDAADRLRSLLHRILGHAGKLPVFHPRDGDVNPAWQGLPSARVLPLQQIAALLRKPSGKSFPWRWNPAPRLPSERPRKRASPGWIVKFENPAGFLLRVNRGEGSSDSEVNRLRKNSGFVSGHDLSRAVNN